MCSGFTAADGDGQSVSRLLCKLINVRLVDVGREAVGVGQGEGSEGGFPALDCGAFDEPAGGFALVSRCPLFLGALAGSFVFDVADGEPEQFDPTWLNLVRTGVR